MTLFDAYEAAAIALCDAIHRDAATRKAAGQSPWLALLPPSEFHDRCLRMAKSSIYLAPKPEADA